MNTATRVALTVTIATAAAMAAPLLVFPGIQALNQLLWQVSYWLPSWLAGPVTWLLVLVLASLAITALALVIIRIWKK
jgi:hypothetical protein